MSISATPTNEPSSDGITASAEKSSPTRREFLSRGAGFLAWTSVGGLGGTALDALFPASASAQTGDDYRALVCVFLAGGNDSFNMLLPLGDDGAPHVDYTATRGSLALADDEWSPLALNMSDAAITALHPRYTGYGIHSGLEFLGAEFAAGHAAFIANVGNLGSYVPGDLTSTKPALLYSHNSQIEQWQTAGDATSQSGWVGRLGDTINVGGQGDASLFANPFKFLSLAGNNVLQLGDLSENFVVTPDSVVELRRPPNAGFDLAAAVAGDDDLSDFQTRYLAILSESLENNAEYEAAWADQQAGDLIERLRDQALAQGEIDEDAAAAEIAAASEEALVTSALKGVVRHMAAARSTVTNMPVRQVFFVIDGGYDHHASLKREQQTKFRDLNRALERFWVNARRAGLNDAVTLFSCSEFGRTMVESNKGSDHGWGGNSFVMSESLASGSGGAGGVIYGKYPTLASAEGDVTETERAFSRYDGNRGRVIPSTSIEEYFAELAMWLGVKNQNALITALGNLAQRWPASGGTANDLPIGFMDAAVVNAGTPLSGAGLSFVVPGGTLDLLSQSSTTLRGYRAMAVPNSPNTFAIGSSTPNYLIAGIAPILLSELELRFTSAASSNHLWLRVGFDWAQAPEVSRTAEGDGSVTLIYDTSDADAFHEIWVPSTIGAGTEVTWLSMLGRP